MKEKVRVQQDFSTPAHRPRATALQTPWPRNSDTCWSPSLSPLCPAPRRKHVDGHLCIRILILMEGDGGEEENSKIFLLLKFFAIFFTVVFLPADTGSEITYAGFLPQVIEMNPTQRCWPQSTGEIKHNSLLLSFQTFLVADPQSSIDLRRD